MLPSKQFALFLEERQPFPVCFTVVTDLPALSLSLTLVILQVI